MDVTNGSFTDLYMQNFFVYEFLSINKLVTVQHTNCRTDDIQDANVTMT